MTDNMCGSLLTLATNNGSWVFYWRSNPGVWHEVPKLTIDKFEWIGDGCMIQCIYDEKGSIC